MKKPKISIIVLVYNTSKYLAKCLDSILAQTYQNLEILCINDGSTDNSLEILKTYAKKDPRIKIVTQKNQGLSSARNQGLAHASGKYLTFIDSDDEVKPSFIAKLLAPYQKDPKTTLSVCGFLRKFVKTKKTENLFLSPATSYKTSDSKKSYILRLLTLDGRLYSVDNKLFIADIAKKYSFDQSSNFAEDTKFVLDYLKYIDANISFILEPLYVYNFGSETSVVNQSSTKWENWQKSYDNLKAWAGADLTAQEKFWLKAVLLRWKISYQRSKARSKKSV